MSLKLMYITNKSEIALIAEKNGVNRICVDLETIGKEERQKNMNTVKSHHSINDIANLSKILTTSELMVRINPIHKNSNEEINNVISAGAKRIMLPMWRNCSEVNEFIDIVNGRVKTTLLLETREADECLNEVLLLPGVDEIHIGLNDLHISYGLTFMFELLANGTVERICRKIAKKGIPYGFGGISKIGDGLLPAENVVMEHYRLGSSIAILSRGFCDTSNIRNLTEIESNFNKNMSALRAYESKLIDLDYSIFENNQRYVCQCVDKIVSVIKEKQKWKE